MAILQSMRVVDHHPTRMCERVVVKRFNCPSPTQRVIAGCLPQEP
jgi:hypothetical protein